MSVGTKTFHCRIDTPDGPVMDDECVSVKLPALDGYMGILAGRAPVTAVVTSGMITLEKSKGQSEEWFVGRGFLRVWEGEVTILAEECKPMKELDAEEAWEMLQRAYKMPSDTRIQGSLRDEAIHAARTRFSLAQKLRKDKGMMSMEDMMSRGL